LYGVVKTADIDDTFWISRSGLELSLGHVEQWGQGV